MFNSAYAHFACVCVCVFFQPMWKTKNSTSRFWRTWGTATWPRTTMRCPQASSTWLCSPERSRLSLKIWWGDGNGWKSHSHKNGNNSTKIFRRLSFIIHSHQHVESIVGAPHVYTHVVETGFPVAAGLWSFALKSGAGPNRPLTIIMALIIHPRPPCMLQHTLCYTHTQSCVSVRPSW